MAYFCGSRRRKSPGPSDRNNDIINATHTTRIQTKSKRVAVISHWFMVLIGTTILASSRGFVLLPKLRILNSGVRSSHFQSLKAAHQKQTVPMVEQVCTDNSTSVMAAKMVPSSSQSLSSCGSRLRAGSLVAFPTETVYGLGCNALDPLAISKVYHAKRRPRTDPLIVHVLTSEDALTLWSDDTSPRVREILRALCTDFFPGPLTLIGKANLALIPNEITANTGYVAIRAPNHPVARQLLKAANVPIGAPSANRYGHVSPTTAKHVWDDLKEEDVWIVDGGEVTVGVESTVAKVVEIRDGVVVVEVLRHGAVSPQNIQDCLEKYGFQDVPVEIFVRNVSTKINTDAPGQAIRHYSPNVPSFMISQKRYQEWAATPQHLLDKEEMLALKNCVVLDFGARLKLLQEGCLAYRDLSSTGSSDEAALNVFDYLRWAEEVQGAKKVYFPQVILEQEKDGLLMALNDRLTRAASGVVVVDLKE